MIWFSFRIFITWWKHGEKCHFWSWHELICAYNKRKRNLILGEGPTQWLDDTTLTSKATYPVDFTQPHKRFVLSLHYNGSNSFLFVNATKIYQFRARDTEIKD